MLMNIPADYTQGPAQNRSAGTTTVAVAPAIVEKVTVRTLPSEGGKGYLLRAPEAWTWEDLRDYVVAQIEARFGVFPRDQRKEYGIFARFAKQYGPDAGRIARYVFDLEDGMWCGAPISIYRFTKASDAYFGDVILSRIG